VRRPPRSRREGKRERKGGKNEKEKKKKEKRKEGELLAVRGSATELVFFDSNDDGLATGGGGGEKTREGDGDAGLSLAAEGLRDDSPE